MLKKTKPIKSPFFQRTCAYKAYIQKRKMYIYATHIHTLCKSTYRFNLILIHAISSVLLWWRWQCARLGVGTPKNKTNVTRINAASETFSRSRYSLACIIEEEETNSHCSHINSVVKSILLLGHIYTHTHTPSKTTQRHSTYRN